MKKTLIAVLALVSLNCWAAPKKAIEPAVVCQEKSAIGAAHREYVKTEKELLQLAVDTPWITYKNVDVEWLIWDIRQQGVNALPYAMTPENKWAEVCKTPTLETQHKAYVGEYMKQLINNINTVKELEPNIQKQANCATEDACNTALSQKLEQISINERKTLFAALPNSSSCFEHKAEILNSFAAVQSANNTLNALIETKGLSEARSIVLPPGVGPDSYSDAVINYWKEHLNDPSLNTPLFLTSCSDWQYLVTSNQKNLEVRKNIINQLN